MLEVHGRAGQFATNKFQGCVWTLELSPLTSSLRRTTVCHFACYVFGRNQPDALVDGNNKEWGAPGKCFVIRHHGIRIRCQDTEENVKP